jgi:hypothetical protein
MAQDSRKKKKQDESEIDSDLNEALKQSFPASDPSAVGQPTGAKPPPAPGEPLKPRGRVHDEPPQHEEAHEKVEADVERQTTVEPEERSIVPGPPIPPKQQEKIKKRKG